MRNIRIIEWFGIEGTFKDRLLQPPAMNRNNIPTQDLADG